MLISRSDFAGLPFGAESTTRLAILSLSEARPGVSGRVNCGALRLVRLLVLGCGRASSSKMNSLENAMAALADPLLGDF